MEAKAKLEEQRRLAECTSPKNLEEQALKANFHPTKDSRPFL